MAEIELTEAQREALHAEPGKAVEVVDPGTRQRYVLLAREQYERVRALLEEGEGREGDSGAEEIPPGILLSQQAFWQELPELLRVRGNRGRWVAYHGGERLGIGSYEGLIGECARRGIPEDAYYLARIRPRELPPWEPEEVEPVSSHHLDDDPTET